MWSQWKVHEQRLSGLRLDLVERLMALSHVRIIFLGPTLALSPSCRSSPWSSGSTSEADAWIKRDRVVEAWSLLRPQPALVRECASQEGPSLRIRVQTRPSDGQPWALQQQRSEPIKSPGTSCIDRQLRCDARACVSMQTCKCRTASFHDRSL